MSITAYIDESGHSGTDLYDVHQPILTYAAVWLEEHQATALASELANFRKRHHVQLREIKGARLLKTAGGQSLVRDALEAISAAAAPVSIVAMQKAYMAAGVVVEDCTDYVYNDAFDERWCCDPRVSEPLIEKILRFSDPQALMRLWQIRGGNDGAAVARAFSSFLFGLSLSLDDELAARAREMQRTNFERLWSAVQGARAMGSDYSPNLSAFNALLHGMDEQAACLSVAAVALVHDAQQQFQALFTSVWTCNSQAEPATYHFPNGNALRFPTDRLKSLAFAESSGHVGIQLADVVAAATRIAIEEHMRGTPDRSVAYLPALRDLMRSPLTGGIFPFAIGTDSWKHDVLAFLLGI